MWWRRNDRPARWSVLIEVTPDLPEIPFVVVATVSAHDEGEAENRARNLVGLVNGTVVEISRSKDRGSEDFLSGRIYYS